LTTTYLISLGIQLAVVIAVVVIVLLLARPNRSSDEHDELELLSSRLREEITSLRSSVASSLTSQTGVLKADFAAAAEQFAKSFPPGIPERLAQLESVLAELSKRVLEMQEDVAHVCSQSVDSIQEFKRIVHDEMQPFRQQLQDLEHSLPTQLKQLAGALEPTVQALEGKLGNRHQAAIDLTLLQLTGALSQTETRLADTSRRQEVLVLEVKSDLRDIQTRLAELALAIRALQSRLPSAEAATVFTAASPRDSAIPLPSRSEPGSEPPPTGT
jgi:chromosome segregation ATPase